jgi:hypothetical protein
MTSLYAWSKIAGNNDVSDSGINFQENQLPSTVNNSCRQVMGRVAEFRDDIAGGLVTTSVGNAYSVTANSAFGTLGDGRILSFRANTSNTGAATLNANALGSKPIRYNSFSGDTEISANMIRAGGVYAVRYSAAANAGGGAWMLQNPSLAAASFSDFTPVQQGGGTGQLSNKVYIGWNGSSLKAQVDSTDLGVMNFAAGTRIVFAQATAPLGWVQDTTVNDRVLTVTSAAGNADGGAWTISGLTVAGTAITVAQLPVHTHPNTLSDPGHGHGINDGTNLRAARFTGAFVSGGGNVDVTTVSPSIIANTTGITINNANAGSGQAHGHGISHDGAWRPAFRSTIICSKS